MVQQDLTDDILTVKSSNVRISILRELTEEDLRRPSEIKEPIRTSDGNFYDSLHRLVEAGLVEKISGKGRTTLYSLTDRGREVIRELGLDQSADSTRNRQTSNRDSSQEHPGDRRAGATPNEELDMSTFEPDEHSQTEVDRRNVAFVKEQLRNQMSEMDITFPEIQEAVEELSNEFAESTKLE